MLKKHTFWLKGAIIFQVLTAAAHSVSFVVTPTPENDTESQMLGLMRTYHMNMGAGFTPTMQDILNSLSACLPLLYLFGGLINWYLLRRKIDNTTLQGVVNIEIVIFGACFITTAFLTFLPPITFTGITLLFLLASRFTFPKS